MDFATAGYAFTTNSLFSLLSKILYFRVSESLAQAFVKDIVECSLIKPIPGNQRLIDLSQDVIESIATSRLAHPKFVMPSVVALQGSSVAHSSAIARAQHVKLHSQYHSTIYDGNREAIVASFHYQSLCQDSLLPEGCFSSGNGELTYNENLEGNFPLAHLNSFYSLVRSSKRDRKAFIHLLIRFFEFYPQSQGENKRSRRDFGSRNATTSAPPGIQSVSAESVGLCKWIAQNLACLEYKTEEEVLTVLFRSNRLVSTLGLSVKNDLEVALQANEEQIRETNWSYDELLYIVTSMCFLVSAKIHLVQTFHISPIKVKTFSEDIVKKSNRPCSRRSDVPYDCGLDISLLQSIVQGIVPLETRHKVLTEFNSLLDRDPVLCTQDHDLAGSLGDSD
jgi:hypothetical protein